MSRSGYSDDYDNWAQIRWRGAVRAAINGARGQAFLKEMLAALDALPEQTLIAGALEENGAVCAIGAVGKARGVDMAPVDPEDPEGVAHLFGIADALASEIAFANDEGTWDVETPQHRWTRMRKWVASLIIPEAAS